MDRDEWQKRFRESFTGKKEKGKKKYEDMTKEEKEKYLRERNKNQDFSGFKDGGVACGHKKDYFAKLKSKIKGKKK